MNSYWRLSAYLDKPLFYGNFCGDARRISLLHVERSLTPLCFSLCRSWGPCPTAPPLCTATTAPPSTRLWPWPRWTAWVSSVMWFIPLMDVLTLGVRPTTRTVSSPLCQKLRSRLSVWEQVSSGCREVCFNKGLVTSHIYLSMESEFWTHSRLSFSWQFITVVVFLTRVSVLGNLLGSTSNFFLPKTGKRYFTVH